jgi:hypothetical protein
MDRVTEFRPTPQMPWINMLLGKRLDEAMSAPGMLGRGCNRKEAEEKLLQSDEYLSLGQRLRSTGTSGWSVLRTEIFWSDETFLSVNITDRKWRTEGITTWSNGHRKRSRLGNAIQLRSEQSPHRPEVKSNERASVNEQSGTLPERPSPAGRNNRRCPS